METCTACNGWFDPRTEGVVQADLFSPAALTLCGICYAARERETAANLNPRKD